MTSVWFAFLRRGKKIPELVVLTVRSTAAFSTAAVEGLLSAAFAGEPCPATGGRWTTTL